MKARHSCSGLGTFRPMQMQVSRSFPSTFMVISVANTYTLGVIEDARFKRKEALADLAAAATKK